jgi:ubiquinone/menaquinone biosynthesis C-methylase UbiE
MNERSKTLPDTFVCPWWLIRFFDNPLRRLVQNPEKILGGMVRPGDRCLDIGCGIGYFTIPLARLVGPSGSVVAVDIQREMLAGVRRRAEAAGLASRIQLHLANSSELQPGSGFDFALAFWMIHEVPDQEWMLREIQRQLKPGGRCLLVEPKAHVNRAEFQKTVALAERVGFSKVADVRIFFSRACLMSSAVGPAA